MKPATIVAVLLLFVAARANEDLEATFAKDVLIVIAGQHTCLRLDVYLAANPAQRQRGLMYVRKLPPATGMLFLYDYEALHSMWMRNTLIPLDILFVRADGSVASVVRNTEPRSEQSIVAQEPVLYVLELNAGMADKWALDEDSRLEWQPDDRG